ncbi:gentisate 1,2-dioxygenase [Paraburkholderia sediminicola]|uniref:gentisate 1,2-dioxygenase n=1 Tax=Paraburkholderia sediminicola TaxID=458836 RepID=UPI0038BD2EFF
MSVSANEVANERQRYYEKIAEKSMTPLWEVLHSLVPLHPVSAIQSHLWRYADLRDDLMEAGQLISAQEAERRVLILENPGVRGQSRITQSIYAGLQLILPGEIAPSHRHAQSALRLVLDGEGAYTTVDGERTTMHRGDFIITPSNTWHDHGNEGDQPVVWLDGLDIPLVQFLGAGFAEKSSLETQISIRPEGDALSRYGRNMLPVDFRPSASEPTRLFVYPYTQTKDALHGIAGGAIDAHFGYKLRYVNPATGASPMPTMGAYAQLLPMGFETKGYRSTDGTVYACLEGSGIAEIGDNTFSFDANDVFVVPSWTNLRLRAVDDVVLFSLSDRPVQEALGLWREQRLQ